ncbi:carbohydrate kinase [Carbonactinospora thermoautotrophica]|uniref:Carbohydrate kinase n=1 Tax=Carbonactinospora thermoautotrophica TaxID=1469144 RepID=A0A132MK51_9ACTN|nr:FGGY family carbohydrate kinase [Carbonactinospora thermoautotrophica]KWW98135.1 carbohydrate kinase [Carbonactinospora thermoautotrophica]KWX02849.1 Xylulokinase [Carbonactinospora thermoautotrophica]
MADPGSAEDVWLGIDLGTQSVRVLAVTADGRLAGRGTHPLTSERRPGEHGDRHEQDPAEWWAALCAAARQALRDVPAGSVRAAAVCGTSGTVLLTDAAGEPLTAALMYDDSRARAEAARAQEAGEAMWARLGHRIQPSWALAKVLWLAAAHPDLLPGSRLAHQPDFVVSRLAGHPVATDSSHALKTGYDLLADRWPYEVYDRLGLPPELFPPVVRPGTLLGRVSPAAGEATGIPAGTPLIAGMTDGCAAQLASGALGVGSWNSVLGTTLVLKGVTPEPVRDPAGVVYSHRSPDGTWLPGGASSVGAGALSAAFPGVDLASWDALAAAREPAGVITYPLVSRGERFPFTAPQAEAFTIGSPADDVDRYAALLQGVAFAERLCFAYLRQLGAPVDGELSFTGGGTRSAYWCQLRADVLGRPARIPEHADPALGMAVLAAYGAQDDTGAGGRGTLAEVARRMVRIRAVVEPRPGAHLRFAEPYARLIDELERRGWLPAPVAAAARAEDTRGA